MGERILTVDQGNGSTKVVLFENGVEVASERLSVLDLEGMRKLCKGFHPSGAAFCSVASEDEAALEYLSGICEGRLIKVSSQTPMVLDIDYSTRATLGADRVAAAEGGRRRFPGKGLLIADCGTALTLDVVDAAGVFRGGNISPGIGLRFRSLHEFTSRLPLVKDGGELPGMGHDTETAIRCGVIRGTAAEIAAMFRRASELHGVELLLLAGGDSTRLFPVLNEDLPGKVIVAEDLVCQGLLSVYEYNFGLDSGSGFRAGHNDNNC